jgi:L-fuconolactonase
LPNVTCKLSGLMNCAAPGAGLDEIRPYAEHVIAAFGPDRVMWASDWPPLDLASDYATWRRHSMALIDRLSPHERVAVLEGTATRVYRLGKDRT